ncbi:Structural maintenance of chromosomes protein 1 [Tulasnella sp. 408]|nr:Structural maintenance of chromosomes protein 1 [Tulasnella sp. 408]
MAPNGSGKSNLMDAFSFVLGIKSAQLRSSQLRGLIYRGRKLARGDSDTADDQEVNGDDGEGTAKKASVMVVFLDNEGNEFRFQRTSLELAEEYEEAKAVQDRAPENAPFHFGKRRGIAGEIKQFREQDNEAERFENLVAEKVLRISLIIHRLLWRLYHIEQAIETNTTEIAAKNDELVQLRAKQVGSNSLGGPAAVNDTKVPRVARDKSREGSNRRPELVQAEAHIAHSTRKAEHASKQAEAVQKEHEKQQRKLEKLNEDLAAVRKLADEAQEPTRKSEAKVKRLQAELAQAKQNLENSQAERARIMQGLLSFLITTPFLTERLTPSLREAAQDSNKEARQKDMMANLQRLFPGVRGRVVDLCKPTQRKYETAVSVILGRNIDTIVVDHEKTGIDCINYLRDQRAGQATFIPLDTIKVKPINDKFRSFAEGARLAVNVIQFDPAIERTMHHACGTALVCDTLEIAKHIYYDEMSAPKFRVTGIRDELKHIEKEIKKQSPEVEKVCSYLHVSDACIYLDLQSKEALSTLVQRVSELEPVIFKPDDKIFSAFCRKINQFQGYSSEFEKDSLRALEERLANLKATAKKETKALGQLEKARKAIQDESDAAEAEINQLRDDMAGVQEEFDEKTPALDEVKKVTARTAKALEKTMKDITLMNDEIEKAASERFSIYRKCRLEEIALPVIRGNLNKVPMEECWMIRTFETKWPWTLMKTKMLPNFLKQVQDYGIEIDFETLDEDDREEIMKIQAEIEKMAPNMNAFEKLDDVEAKLAATDKEADKARKQSKDAREEFNRVRKERCYRFNKAFTHISERMDKVYKDLTKGKHSPMGGIAYLSLEDSEVNAPLLERGDRLTSVDQEPYLSSIKYHAMPPMKCFRDMEQLSGGEKTVAVALLFAIHSYQLSLLFVLNEVNAALDNTNVAKVAKYIQSQASDEFQFIVISLKCSLYEKSDSLIGVHRDQDVNSSRILTLNVNSETTLQPPAVMLTPFSQLKQND